MSAMREVLWKLYSVDPTEGHDAVAKFKEDRLERLKEDRLERLLQRL